MVSADIRRGTEKRDNNEVKRLKKVKKLSHRADKTVIIT